jgi:uncharacterized protein (TIGR00369 family)
MGTMDETIRTWIDTAENDPPFHRHLGLRVHEIGDGTSRVSLPLTDQVRGSVAPIHGGVLASLSDIACACAIGGFDRETTIPVSTELHVRFYGQPRQSPLMAAARVVHQGRQLVGTECTITDATGRQVARATATYMVIRGFGSRAADLPDQPLPA